MFDPYGQPTGGYGQPNTGGDEYQALQNALQEQNQPQPQEQAQAAPPTSSSPGQHEGEVQQAQPQATLATGQITPGPQPTQVAQPQPQNFLPGEQDPNGGNWPDQAIVRRGDEGGGGSASSIDDYMRRLE